MCTNMGGIGITSGLSGGSLPKLQGSEKQVNWAENIRDSALETIAQGYKNAKEDYEKFKTFQDKMKMEIYKDLDKGFRSQFQKIDSASKIIDMRHGISPANITDKVMQEASDRAMQKLNGWEWDAKKRKMVKK